MIIHLHTRYCKAYRQRIQHDSQLSKHVNRRIQLFLNNASHPLLRVHHLKGTKGDLWSFSVTGDIRIIFEHESSDTVIFYDIGTHNQVY